ncbi:MULTISPECIES: exodeoxyribonuclease V subunit beta [Stenotrophomonas]|jgi:exodeoxyribonuclease V beta subunit|uniref:exodeoxyribonuclease V subunit beta n=1 Tax=Stenotrophomonas TaxID=40323 RepID=UPI0024DF018D|nr:exodeoxyribonuclease V subunit beta [Stenotrophomonas sp. BIO128-Bstrain]WIA61186.1 exodeoxyribonuclease V subunit beta [Stenotrophomonas sp. BIO128-Bstrain]
MTDHDLLNDPYLALPLDGVRLIEASAGTGKTFTLATLFTRLVVEKGWRIGQILAVTFTDAATQELRKRIRERLALAAQLVERAPGEQDSPEVALTRVILQRQLALGEETPAALARRLQTAADEIDLASIFTIHGFCTRVLREHALESGHTFDPPTLLPSERELHEELAADLWRVHANDPATVDALTWLWSSPEALAGDLSTLIKPLPLLPARPTRTFDDPAPQLRLTAAALAEAIQTHVEDAQAQIAVAFDRKVFDGRRAKRPSFDKAFGELLAGRSAQHWPRGDKSHLGKLLPVQLLAFCKDGMEGQCPASPLFDALQAWWHAADAREQWLRQQATAFLHDLRDEARARLAELKRIGRVQTYDDLIDGVADALEGPHRATLVQQLRAQYAIALVDEFQDTDDRQWGIFQRVFGDSEETRDAGLAPALFLIGDPKQAIYGFRGGDIHTYLKAKRQADAAPALDRNFRSRPAVLHAIEALYANAGERAFLEADIAFEPVHPGSTRMDADFLRDGLPAPGLTVRVLHNTEGGDLKADPSRQQASDACVAAIHQILSEARQGRALLRDVPVQPGDIAVLVRSHKEATRIQQALGAVGIPAVAAGKQSLYATPEAHDLRLLLLALLQPADEGRLRAALSTVLLGEDAEAIDALEREGDAQRSFQVRLLEWRERWQRGGPFAVIADLCAEHAERLLGLLDGERRLTNYLQLGELLQQAAGQTLGMHGLLDWLQVQMAHADQNDEQQLLRLESDARRVQIITLHKSKGLEYPLVFLPFVGIGGGAPNTEANCTVYANGRRELHWKLDKDDSWNAASTRSTQEQDAEDARLLYVGLTRAEHALWIAAGDLAGLAKTRLAPMLSDLEALRAHPDIAVIEGPVEPRPAQLAFERDGELPPVRALTRRVPHDWWVYSFTQLAHADAGHDTDAAATEVPAPAADEPAGVDLTLEAEQPAVASEESDPRFMGSRFGNVLHDALENTDFAQWGGWQAGETAPGEEAEVLRASLRAEGYAEQDLDDGVAMLTGLVGQTLTVPLPEGGALHDLPADARRAEIEFHFAMQPTAVPALLSLLHAHGLVRDRHGFGTRRRLEGLMTGKIDLTYVRADRWYVLDYKSNRLPGYDAARLASAMQHSEYDLQALIYTVALHRWLRFRLGAQYDYARDMGGIRYLFCRGLDARRDDSPGLYAHRFDPALVDALDALFAGGEHAQARMAARARGEA